MKLLSGHEVVEVSEEERKKFEDFKGYHPFKIIKLKPGNWFFLNSFLNYANKISSFGVRILFFFVFLCFLSA